MTATRNAGGFCSFLAAAGLALLAAVLPSKAGAEALSYDVFIRGFRVGEVKFESRNEGDVYKVQGVMGSRGFFGGFIRRQFAQVDITYEGNGPKSVVRTPARQAEAFDVDPVSLSNVLDPITATWVLLGDVKTRDLCSHNFRVFDGSRVSGVRLAADKVAKDVATNEAAEAEETAQVVTCLGNYTRIAGFTPAQLSERTVYPFRLQYSKIRDETWRVSRFAATVPMTRIALPIDAVLPQITDALARHPNLVIQAAPGAGKTTRVPVFLDDALGHDRKGGRILMLEPRRVAARSSAVRMAQERGEAVGGSVGYAMRGERKVSAATRIEVVTEGILTRMLQSDPELADVACVIFDEFHERSLPADLGLALTLDVQSALRPDLQIIVMSATLDTQAVAQLLGDATVVTAPGRAFDVETRWADKPWRGGPTARGPKHGRGPRFEDAAADLIIQAVTQNEGHQNPD